MKKAVKWMSILLPVAVCALTVAAFLPEMPRCLSAAGAVFLKIQPACSWTFTAVLLLTFIWGRFFCEKLCPLGILQSFVNWLFHRRGHIRRVCSRLPQSRRQVAVRWVVFGALALLGATGYWGAAYFLTPYAIVGKALVLFMPAVVLFFAVLAVSALGSGRFWCNWVCPVGTLFSVLSLLSLRKSKVGQGCSNCRKCFGVQQGKRREGCSCEGGLTRREAVHGAALLAVTGGIDKTVDGGFAPVSLPGEPERPSSLLPPGAGSAGEFARKCVGCGLCVTRCPSKVIRLSRSFKTYGQPELYFSNGYCRLSCNYKCASACPTGALLPRTSDRTKLHFGAAHWNKELCVRTCKGDECKACERNCPVNAVKIVNGAVVVDADACVGCGACEHVCPSRPEPAICVWPLERQREILPMGETDLIDEMMSLVKAGESCVLADRGVIVARSKDRGIKPLLDFCANGKLKGVIVADKIIGLAAAVICVHGGAKQVYAVVMTKEAARFLSKHGIASKAQQEVEGIQNRAKNGLCPMEKIAKAAMGAGASVEECFKKLSDAVANLK